MAHEPLKIVMLAAEASPLAKVGGLGDVIAALPKALEQLGAQVSVVIPAYRSIRTDAAAVHPCKAVPGFDVAMASSVQSAEILQARLSGTQVDVYLIASRNYFDRDGIYTDPATGEGYPDDAERFTFFMKSALELLVRIGKSVDVIHCHDSQTALVPAMLKLNYQGHPFFSKAGTLFTIHNLAYQGIYPRKALDHAGISPDHFYPQSPFEYWGQVNFMKAGIAFADKVNTVSRTYAREILSDPEFGFGLEGVLQSRAADVSGIVNGIDYDEWNPEADPLIAARYSIRDRSGKKRCKEDLQRRFRLPVAPAVPLLGIVSRMVDQKGFDLLAEAMGSLMALNLQLVILGTGQKKYHSIFRQIASRYPGRVGVELSFDNELAHKIEAGCDMFLMPSKFEPCGLNQLYSLRYGTIPIVRKTGGLADTVIQFDGGGGTGTGFSFSQYSPEAMLAAIRQALTVYDDAGAWEALIVRAMSQDWSWSRSAGQYLQLYQNICSTKLS